jgi:3-hydroxyisobutyrate dehydrogenase-like beta-hydroxyacid dehydrogenase
MTTVGLVHPGEMGAAVGATLRSRGIDVLWASDGRGRGTVGRAEAAGLTDAGDIAELAKRSDVVLSICPPHAAIQVAESVAAQGFSGVYVDANAVSPTTALAVAAAIPAADYVDGGIIGGPPADGGSSTRLYLSGPRADEMTELLGGGPLTAIELTTGPTAASALKMTYAAWTKGTAALLLAIRGAATRAGVADALYAEWAQSQPGLAQRLESAQRSADSKGWRWTAEMREIAAAFEATGQPAGFHEAAAEIYERFDRPD